MIPQFRLDGTLPECVHVVTDWVQIELTFRSSPRRRKLLNTAVIGVKNLAEAGCEWVLLDGSFVTAKPNPNDIDSCWEWNHNMDLTRLDPSFLSRDFKDRIALLGDYGLDFFVAGAIEMGTGLPFSEFFQRERDGGRKGIIRLKLQGFKRRP